MRDRHALRRLVAMADNVLKYKYIVKNVARKHGKTATFMPKPLFDGQRHRHARPHLAVEERHEPVRRHRLRGPVATSAMYAIGGLLKHAPALCAHHQPDDQQLQAAGARVTRPR